MHNYRFGDFELDLGALQLRLRGVPVKLERRPFDLLAMLVTHQGRVVSREDIVAALWPPKVIIDFDGGLHTLVRKVRNALGDSPDAPRFIETVSGRGYRFIAPVVADGELSQPEPKHPPVTRSAAPRRTRFVVVTAASLALLVGAALLLRQGWDVGPTLLRVAVLPFENLAGDDDLAYLASGLAEETSMSLAQIDPANLRVIGGVSAKAMVESALPLQRIRREIGVDFLVLSSLRSEQSRIRVTSRLIRVADSEQVWSASFDRELTDALSLQRELSIAIAEQIRLRLSPEVAASVARRQTQNPRAYELYLKGRYEWSQLSPASNRRAVQYYEQAVLEDPSYALAWAGIAHALTTSMFFADTSPEATLERARTALRNALQYGPDLAETRYAEGYFYNSADWDLVKAEAAARLATVLDPNSAIAQMLLGVVLNQAGDHMDARAAMRRARELDPLFSQTYAISSMVAANAGNLEEALELARQAIAINPEAWVGHLHLGNAQFALRHYDAAVRAFSDAERLGGNTSATVGRIRALVRMNREEDARQALVDVTSGEYVPPTEVACAQAVLGKVDAAFEWLERALAERHPWFRSIPTDDCLAPLRADPRFDALLKRGGIASSRSFASAAEAPARLDLDAKDAL